MLWELDEDTVTSTKGQLRNVSWGKIIIDIIWKIGGGKGGQ